MHLSNKHPNFKFRIKAKHKQKQNLKLNPVPSKQKDVFVKGIRREPGSSARNLRFKVNAQHPLMTTGMVPFSEAKKKKTFGIKKTAEKCGGGLSLLSQGDLEKDLIIAETTVRDVEDFLFWDFGGISCFFFWGGQCILYASGIELYLFWWWHQSTEH